MNNWIKLNTKECDICGEIYKKIQSIVHKDVDMCPQNKKK